MRKNLLLLLFFLTGCTVTGIEQPQTTERSALKVFSSADAIDQLMVGQTRQESQTLLGIAVMVGFEQKPDQSLGKETVNPILVQNPYRSENIEKNNKHYMVDYYLTHIYQADGIITDDELTPLVFQNDRLVGKGWEFFKKVTSAR